MTDDFKPESMRQLTQNRTSVTNFDCGFNCLLLFLGVFLVLTLLGAILLAISVPAFKELFSQLGTDLFLVTHFSFQWYWIIWISFGVELVLFFTIFSDKFYRCPFRKIRLVLFFHAFLFSVIWMMFIFYSIQLPIFSMCCEM